MIYVNLYILELLKLFTVCNVADNLPIMHLIIFSRYMAIALKILSSKTIIDIFSLNCNNENYNLKIKMKLFLCLLDDENKAIIVMANWHLLINLFLKHVFIYKTSSLMSCVDKPSPTDRDMMRWTAGWEFSVNFSSLVTVRWTVTFSANKAGDQYWWYQQREQVSLFPLHL